MKEYRILIEVDRHGNHVFSYAVIDTSTEKVEEWFGSLDEAVEYVDENGTLATD